MSQIQIAVFLLIPLFLASVAWLWTIVLAFRYKDFGMAILSILLPAWMVEGYDAILAVDVGGTNIRAGIVELNISKGKDLSKACVLDMEHWCHQEEDGIKRVMLGGTVDGVFTTVEDVAQTVLFLSTFPTAALTGQSFIVSHGWYMQ